MPRSSDSTHNAPGERMGDEMGNQVEVNAEALAKKLDNAGLTGEEKAFLANIMVTALNGPEVEGFFLGPAAGGAGFAAGSAAGAGGFAAGSAAGAAGVLGGVDAAGFGPLLTSFQGSQFSLSAGPGGTSAGVVV